MRPLFRPGIGKTTVTADVHPLTPARTGAPSWRVLSLSAFRSVYLTTMSPRSSNLREPTAVAHGIPLWLPRRPLAVSLIGTAAAVRIYSSSSCVDSNFKAHRRTVLPVAPTRETTREAGYLRITQHEALSARLGVP